MNTITSGNPPSTDPSPFVTLIPSSAHTTPTIPTIVNATIQSPRSSTGDIGPQMSFIGTYTLTPIPLTLTWFDIVNKREISRPHM